MPDLYTHQGGCIQQTYRESYNTLREPKIKKLILNPSTKFQKGYYIDADFARLWNIELDQILVC